MDTAVKMAMEKLYDLQKYASDCAHMMHSCERDERVRLYGEIEKANREMDNLSKEIQRIEHDDSALDELAHII